VHEGPISLSPHLRPAGFAEGMIVSNEPGFYLPGHYGIRLENLLLVRPAAFEGPKAFLRFETLTLAPFDRQLIDTSLLTKAELDWVNHYHQRVLDEVGPKLAEDAATWLAASCAPLSQD
jgi:Xaa-Pro aminopeptidase